MKKQSWLFCLAGMMVILFCLISCHDSSPTGLDFTDESTISSFPYVMDFYNNGNNSYVRLTAPEDKAPPTVELDGVVREIVDMGEGEQIVYYTYCLDDPAGMDRQSVRYKITIEGKAYSGTLSMPPALQVNVPDFNPDEDYVLNWTANHDPGCFLVTLYVRNQMKGATQFPGTLRSYTVNKSNWGEDGWGANFDVMINAINYNRHGKVLLAMSSSPRSFGVFPPIKGNGH